MVKMDALQSLLLEANLSPEQSSGLVCVWNVMGIFLFFLPRQRLLPLK